MEEQGGKKEKKGKRREKKEKKWIDEDEMKNSDDFENHFVKDFYFTQ